MAMRLCLVDDVDEFGVLHRARSSGMDVKLQRAQEGCELTKGGTGRGCSKTARASAFPFCPAAKMHADHPVRTGRGEGKMEGARKIVPLESVALRINCFNVGCRSAPIAALLD